MRSLENQSVVVTGGAQGVGLSVARVCLREGAHVLLVGRTEDKLKNAVSELASLGRVEFFASDITQPASASQIVEVAKAKFPLHTLVNCAGVFVWKKFLDVKAEDWQRTMATNLSAPFFLSQAFAQELVAQKSPGCIVNISSIHAHVGDANVVPQCASKAGLVGMTQAIAEALRAFDIRVNAIAPGAIEPKSSVESGSSPQKKVTQADVAELVAYLASAKAQSITGSVFNVFGSTRPIIASH